MTFKIEILTETGAEARQQMALFLGLPFAPMSTLSPSEPNIGALVNRGNALEPDAQTLRATWAAGAPVVAEEPEMTEEQAAAYTETEEQFRADDAAKPKRQRGQPSPGKARRTKAEIAEDEAAEKAPDWNETVQSMISAGEERVDPDAAQDAADEAAETAASRTSDAPTLDDMRWLMGAVQKKHGMAVAATIPALLGKGVADLTPEELPAALAAVQGLLDGTDQTPVEQKQPETPTATADDVRAAMKRYALKYDGTDTDVAKMKFALEDSPKVFQMLFGEKVLKVSDIPADPAAYAKAVAGLDEMLTVNPFKR